MICEAHISIFVVTVAPCMCTPGGHYHEKVHGALMHLSGVVKIEYLLGSQSLNVLLWGIQNSVSTRFTKPYCLTCQVLSLLLSAGVDTIPEYRYNWSWRCCWVVEEISNAMLCRGVFAIVVVGSIGSPGVKARILMNSTWIILKVWWIVVYII